MGNYCCHEELVHPAEDVLCHDGREGKADVEEKKVFQVKLRMTAKELRELVARAESGETIGPALLRKFVLDGNYQFKESPWCEREDEGIRRNMKRLETIREEENS